MAEADGFARTWFGVLGRRPGIKFGKMLTQDTGDKTKCQGSDTGASQVDR